MTRFDLTRSHMDVSEGITLMTSHRILCKAGQPIGLFWLNETVGTRSLAVEGKA
jgi:hypothetical protein